MRSLRELTIAMKWISEGSIYMDWYRDAVRWILYSVSNSDAMQSNEVENFLIKLLDDYE